MSQHKPEAETNPRRSKRKRVAKVDRDCIHESARTNKKTKTLEEDASSKQNEKETSTDGGLRRIERKGRFLKGISLLSQMTERRRKKESQRAEIERSKQNEKKQEEKEPLRKMEDPPGPGYSLPSSIFSNIPDVGLCTFEEEIAAMKTSSVSSGKTLNSKQSSSTTKRQRSADKRPSKRGQSCDDMISSSSSEESQTEILLKAAKRRSSRSFGQEDDFEARSPEIALQNSVNPIRYKTPCDKNLTQMWETQPRITKQGHIIVTGLHSKMLESWNNVSGPDSSKAPVLWALEHMNDKLEEHTDWMTKARAIWTNWKKLPLDIRKSYVAKAKENRNSSSAHSTSYSDSLDHLSSITDLPNSHFKMFPTGLTNKSRFTTSATDISSNSTREVVSFTSCSNNSNSSIYSKGMDTTSSSSNTTFSINNNSSFTSTEGTLNTNYISENPIITTPFVPQAVVSTTFTSNTLPLVSTHSLHGSVLSSNIFKPSSFTLQNLPLANTNNYLLAISSLGNTTSFPILPVTLPSIPITLPSIPITTSDLPTTIEYKIPPFGSTNVEVTSKPSQLDVTVSNGKLHMSTAPIVNDGINIVPIFKLSNPVFTSTETGSNSSVSTPLCNTKEPHHQMSDLQTSTSLCSSIDFSASNDKSTVLTKPVFDEGITNISAVKLNLSQHMDKQKPSLEVKTIKSHSTLAINPLLSCVQNVHENPTTHSTSLSNHESIYVSKHQSTSKDLTSHQNQSSVSYISEPPPRSASIPFPNFSLASITSHGCSAIPKHQNIVHKPRILSIPSHLADKCIFTDTTIAGMSNSQHERALSTSSSAIPNKALESSHPNTVHSDVREKRPPLSKTTSLFSNTSSTVNPSFSTLSPLSSSHISPLSLINSTTSLPSTPNYISSLPTFSQSHKTSSDSLLSTPTNSSMPHSTSSYTPTNSSVPYSTSSSTPTNSSWPYSTSSSTPTNSSVPYSTSSSTPTNSSVPYSTSSSTPTNSSVPYSTSSSTPTNSSVPYSTSSSTPTNSSWPYSTSSSTPTNSSVPYSTSSSTPTNSSVPYSTSSSTPTNSSVPYSTSSSTPTNSSWPYSTSSSTPTNSSVPYSTSSSTPTNSSVPYSTSSSTPTNSSWPYSTSSSTPTNSSLPYSTSSSTPTNSSVPYSTSSSTPTNSSVPYSISSSTPTNSSVPYSTSSSTPTNSSVPYSTSSSTPTNSSWPYSTSSSNASSNTDNYLVSFPIKTSSNFSNTTQKFRSHDTQAKSSSRSTNDHEPKNTNETSSSCITKVTDEWKKNLLLQIREVECFKQYTPQPVIQPPSVPKKKPKPSPQLSDSAHVQKEGPKKSRKRALRSDILSRPPMKVPAPCVLQSNIPLSSSPPLLETIQPHFPLYLTPHTLQNTVGLATSMSSPLTPPCLSSPMQPFPQLPGKMAPVSPSAPIKRQISGNASIPSPVDDNTSLPTTPTSALEYQATNDALNYADLERHYWYSLLLFEQHKKNVLALKDRLTKARIQQQVMLLQRDKFKKFTEMIVNPISEPVIPDLTKGFRKGEVTADIRLSGTFDKPVLEGESTYNCILQPLF